MRGGEVADTVAGETREETGRQRSRLVARLRHILLFALLGSIGTAAHYAVLISLVQSGATGPVLGSSAGFLIGGVVNYVLSHRVVFRSDKRHSEAIGKFFAVAGVGLALNAVLMALLTHSLALPYLPSQIVVTGLLVLWHYGGNALWTFRAH